MESSKTWRTEALKSFAISKSGMQGGEAKRNLPWSNFLWQSCQPLLEHFLESKLCMLYIVSKLRKSKIQCFKRCVIRSWNEGVTVIASRSLQSEGNFCTATKSPFCCKMISQPFCTVLWNSSWSFLIFATRWKPNTASWKPISQRCEISLLLRSDFAALFVRLRNLVDLVFTCEVVLSAYR